MFLKLIIIYVVFVVIFTNYNQVYANEFINLDVLPTETDKPLGGTAKEIKKISDSINTFLPYQMAINFQDNTISNGFIEKPEIVDTASRHEIEKQKQLEEQQRSYEEYQKTLVYDNYSRNVITRESTFSRSDTSNTNLYNYGYCTWYVASQKNIPSFWGNASQWLYSASTTGYNTGEEPKEGSIIVTNESGWGHVGVVEKVENDKVIISEMNYSSWGVINNRELTKDNPVIKGFIYY